MNGGCEFRRRADDRMDNVFAERLRLPGAERVHLAASIWRPALRTGSRRQKILSTRPPSTPMISRMR
jgi:hypothetical protein